MSGEVATAACGGKRERNEAQRSTIAPCYKRAQSRAPQEGCEALRSLLPLPEKSIDFVGAFFNEIRLTASEIASL